MMIKLKKIQVQKQKRSSMNSDSLIILFMWIEVLFMCVEVNRKTGVTLEFRNNNNNNNKILIWSSFYWL